jgi:hypothetical protein
LNLGQAVAGLESQLETLGYSAEYCVGIRRKATKGRTDVHALHLYRAALQRTLNAKARRKEAVENPV